jgi:hypothetical protein
METLDVVGRDMYNGIYDRHFKERFHTAGKYQAPLDVH